MSKNEFGARCGDARAKIARRSRARARLAGLLLCSTVLCSSGALPVPAARAQQTEALSISIPAQPLNAAIDAFSRSTGWQIGYSSSIDGTVRTHAVSGIMTPRQALQTMLSGTGIDITITGASSAALVDPSAPAADFAGDGSLLLDTITINGGGRDAVSGSGFQGTPDWVYEAPESVSVVSREAIDNAAARDTRDLLNSVSGVYSGEGQGSFPTVSPNIRGLQDSGRVVVSIDGARQNLQEGGRYGSSGLSNFGMAFVDSAFIRAVEVDKDPDASAGNAGSLGGSVDFQTVGADDIILPGKEWGVELDGTRGTNAYKFQGSAIAAARINDSVSVLGGISRLRLGEFEPGTRGAGGGTYNSLKSRDAWSSLAKLEGDFGDIETSLSWMHQQNDYAYGISQGTNSFDARVDSVTAKFDWNPENALIDFGGRFWLNNSEVTETRSRPGTPETSIDKKLTSFGGVLENTSEVEMQAGLLTLNYGVEAFRDDSDKSVSSTTVAEEPRYASRYGTFTPPGQRDVASVFANGKWEPTDWLTVSGGLRYDWYRLTGTPTYYEFHPGSSSSRLVGCETSRYDYEVSVGTDLSALPPPLIDVFKNQCGEIINDHFYYEGSQYWTNTPASYEPHTLEIDRSFGALLPSLTVETRPTDWFRPYASYSQSLRPPTITEAFITGGLAPADGIGTDLAPNVHLRPEAAQTFEIGANVSFDGLFHPDDRVRLKIAGFHREIEDYIVMGYIQTDDALGAEFNSFVNAAGITRMRGLELEGNYDAGSFWLGGALTLLETKWPTKTQTFNNGSTEMIKCIQYACGVTTSGDIFAISGNVPPKLKITLDGGVRMLERKLILGARLNHVTPTLSLDFNDDGDLVPIRSAFTTLDLYGSYEFNENAKLRFAVNNVTDQNYVAPTANYTAPGRTYTASLKLKF